MKHVGLHAHRLRAEADNPREVAFAEQWEEANIPRWVPTFRDYKESLLDALLDDDATPREVECIATVIQWLGSNVGFSFLGEALDRCGYKIVEKEEPPK